MAFLSYPSADSIDDYENGSETKVAIVDDKGTILSVNEAWRSSAIALGYRAEGHGVGVNYLDLCDEIEGPDAGYARQAAQALRSVLAGACTQAFTYVCASVDQEHWAVFITSPLPPNWSPGASIIHVGVSQFKEIGEALRLSESWLRLHVDALPILVAYIDKEHRYQLNNQAYQEWFGVSSGELRGKTVWDVIGTTAYEDVRPHIETCLSGKAVDFEKTLGMKDGRQVHVRCSYVPDSDELAQVRGMFAFVQDVTRERSLAVRIEHQSMHDALTGLPNRTLLQNRLSAALKGLGHPAPSSVLMILDLDDFKDVNDSLGHPIGDKLLRAVAHRLVQSVEPDDIVARLGGDEFAIVRIETATNGGFQALATKLIERIEAPFCIDEHEIHISASIGIARIGNEVAEVSQLMKQADLALYSAKAVGQGCHRTFVDKMWTDLMRRQRMLQALRDALHNKQLKIRYQPQIDLGSGALVGVEALTRWRHPTCGEIEPKTFIPIAESSGLISKLGHWVMSEASTQAIAWRRAGHDFRVTVNVSPTQIKQAGFLDQVRRVMSSGVEPDWLELEITEAVLIEANQRERRILDEVVDLGIRLAIDDFGSGYSSLAYLKRLPVEKIKIDQTFVRNIGVDTDDEAIIKAMVTLGHQLGKCVIAEGVETASQADFLLENGCDEAQGFHFARPLSERCLMEWIEKDPLVK